MRSEVLMFVTAAVAALIAFAFYRRRLWLRRCRINAWIGKYLVSRFGALPPDLHINCSDDELSPVLVSFKHHESRNPLLLQFRCSGLESNYRLSDEKVVKPVDQQ